MNGIRNPFKREGVPPRDAVMAALGVEKAKKGLERERKGAKGLDEIGLSAAEMREAKKVESWTREDVCNWVQSFWNSNNDLAEWMDRTFRFKSDGTILAESGLNLLMLERLTSLPPKLIVRGKLIVLRSGLQDIPPDLRADQLDISGTAVDRIPEGIQVGTIILVKTQIKKLPDDIGAITDILVSKDQESLIQDAEAKGVNVHFDK